jgi:hypothetical protein
LDAGWSIACAVPETMYGCSAGAGERAQRVGVSHLLYISIVGVDRNPHYVYYRVKRDTEKVFERSSVPWTSLMATQFHEFVLKQIQFLERGPFALVPKGFLLQQRDLGRPPTGWLSSRFRSPPSVFRT